MILYLFIGVTYEEAAQRIREVLEPQDLERFNQDLGTNPGSFLHMRLAARKLEVILLPK